MTKKNTSDQGATQPAAPRGAVARARADVAAAEVALQKVDEQLRVLSLERSTIVERGTKLEAEFRAAVDPATMRTISAALGECRTQLRELDQVSENMVQGVRVPATARLEQACQTVVYIVEHVAVVRREFAQAERAAAFVLWQLEEMKKQTESALKLHTETIAGLRQQLAELTGESGGAS
jgi:hypothetical protein